MGSIWLRFLIILLWLLAMACLFGLLVGLCEVWYLLTGKSLRKRDREK